eukprot:Nitzschia sp. Nitz4//scaffold256_size27904//1818//5050//NITZ4_008166-RA/size27904-snap-gene-0.10-mRNA-1//-1//CDS//3329544402//1548//frame0
MRMHHETTTLVFPTKLPSTNTESALMSSRNVAANDEPETAPTNNPDLVTFPAGRPGHSSTTGHDMFGARVGSPTRTSVQEPLMGPLLRRKRVVSMPLGAGGDFFMSADQPSGPHRFLATDVEQARRARRQRQTSYDPTRAGSLQTSPENDVLSPLPPLPTPKRERQTTPQANLMSGILRRRQVSLDLLGPNDFFGVPEEEEVDEPLISEPVKEEEMQDEEVSPDAISKEDLFFPLRFAPRQKVRSGTGGGHGGGGHGGGGHGGGDAPCPDGPSVDEDMQKAMERYVIAHEQIQAGLQHLKNDETVASSDELSKLITKMDDSDEVIDLVMHMDGNVLGEEHEAMAHVDIIGVETGTVKASYEFGPPEHERISLDHAIVVNFEHPDEPHIINVTSTVPEVELSFTLLADVKHPLADNSVIVAAIIMVVVYAFILLEVIHRTLVAIYGSMVALMFYFVMEGSHVESIHMIMLHLEWSTLGLLFGMMLIVGELSHTGVFEWCAVRVLLFSKGSYVRLLVLLSTLTAVASAFLDNVTTMLLVAPVTIDLCHIVGDIDPRPYLIAEVILSNIGGTATLIGDPPNIIIGSEFSDIIGFVDFITNILPLVFIFCVPISLVVLVYLYRWYLTSAKMRVLDTALLKKTYRIYDEPRLLIAGIVTSFVILMFFMHPLHHKDTAWIALLGAFVTIAFTNPHDIQSALRSHIEWDTLLFFAGLFVLVEVCASMGLLDAIGDALATFIAKQDEDKQLAVAVSLILWVSAIASSFLDNIPYTATMIPVIRILADELPDTLPLETLAWALSLGACLGGNGTLLGASANIVTAGISTNKGYEVSFVNFLYPGMVVMFVTVALSNVYMLVRYVWL